MSSVESTQCSVAPSDHGLNREARRRAPAALFAQVWSADLCASILLVVLTLVAVWPIVVDGTVIGIDAATFFNPVYTFLGERLRSGHIPMWNPHQFSGAPFAADPQSGWMYLPAMVLFTLLPLVVVAKAYMIFNLLLAGLRIWRLDKV